MATWQTLQRCFCFLRHTVFISCSMQWVDFVSVTDVAPAQRWKSVWIWQLQQHHHNGSPPDLTHKESRVKCMIKNLWKILTCVLDSINRHAKNNLPDIVRSWNTLCALSHQHICKYSVWDVSLPIPTHQNCSASKLSALSKYQSVFRKRI